MSFLPAFLGGCLIGLSASVLLIANGRVAGVSGIVSGIVSGLWLRDGHRMAVNLAFVAGLLLGPVLFRAWFHRWPDVTVTGSLPVLIIAGLLVGFGSRMGSGCTSGHGVVGLARLSPRSIAAVATFVLSAMLTVDLMRRGGWS